MKDNLILRLAQLAESQYILEKQIEDLNRKKATVQGNIEQVLLELAALNSQEGSPP